MALLHHSAFSPQDENEEPLLIKLARGGGAAEHTKRVHQRIRIAIHSPECPPSHPLLPPSSPTRVRPLNLGLCFLPAVQHAAGVQALILSSSSSVGFKKLEN